MVASSGFDLPLIVDDAVQLSGGAAMTVQDVQNARVALSLILNEWSNRGYNTWRVRENVGFTLLEADSSVLLTRTPVIDDVVVVRVQLSDTNYTILRRMSPDEYGRLSTPGLKGLPTSYYVERTDTPRMHFYPVGRPGQDETLLMTVVERPTAFDRLGADVDAPARWLNAVIAGIAVGVCKRRTPLDRERLSVLQEDYVVALGDALGADRHRVPWRMRI